MTTPATAAARFGAAFLIGAGLGLYYAFLRPLRPKHSLLSDLLFLGAVFWSWLILAFGICRGDLRMSYCAAAFLGGFLFDSLPGQILRPVFCAFWKVTGAFGRILSLPGKKILILTKKMIASGEKWVTIRWSNRRHMTHTFGGKPYGRIKRIFQSDQAGPDADAQPGEDRSDPGHRIVYGRTDHPAARRDGSE